MTATPYRRRVLKRAEILAILDNQGADLSALSLLSGALREKQIWNAIEAQELAIPCGHCKASIRRRQDCIRDHKIRLRSMPIEQRAAYDQVWNQWYLCLECNRLKTHQRGLTGLGSDASLIAKLRRVERKQRNKQPPQCHKQPKRQESKPCRKAAIASRPFPPQSRTLPSRPFPKAHPTQARRIPSRPFPTKRGKGMQPEK